MKIHSLFKADTTKQKHIISRVAPADIIEFEAVLRANINNIVECKELILEKYELYLKLFNTIKITKENKNTVKSLFGFFWNYRTLDYYITRGWNNTSARIKLREVQGTNSVKAIAKRKNCSIEEAQIILDARSRRGLETLKARDDYKEITHSRGNSNRAHFYLDKINPDTNLFFTEEEAKLKVASKQRIGFVNMWADVKAGKRIYCNNTMLDYYLARGATNDEAIKLLQKRQTTFSKELCIEKLGEEDGIKRWQERQTKWLKTLDAFSPEEKRSLIERKTFRSKRYSKEATNFIIKLLTALELDKNDQDIYLCENEKFMWIDGKLNFFDLYIKKYNFYLEYNGSCFHPNPQKLDTIEKWNSWIHPILRISADTMKAKDDSKIKGVNSVGGILVTVWDTDDKEQIILDLVKLLKKDI